MCLYNQILNYFTHLNNVLSAIGKTDCWEINLQLLSKQERGSMFWHAMPTDSEFSLCLRPYHPERARSRLNFPCDSHISQISLSGNKEMYLKTLGLYFKTQHICKIKKHCQKNRKRTKKGSDEIVKTSRVNSEL
jgi:hypothetical protein